MKIETATVVGERNYIENFFNYSLNSLLQEQNISLIKNGDLIINVIFKENERK